MKNRGKIIIFSLAVIVALGAVQAVGASVEPRFNAGFTIYDFEQTRPDNTKYTVTTAIWYPTTERERRVRYGARPILGRAARDAAPDPDHGPYPLVIYSHGYGGSGICAPYLTEHLARLGFVVAAPDHDDVHKANRIRPPAEVDIKDYLAAALRLARSGTDFDREAHAYRPRTISFVIDRMLALSGERGSRLYGTIDADRIGMCGHSLGSFTTLACVGAGAAYQDERIKAAVSISGGVFMWRAEDYDTVRVPIMFMYGELESTENWPVNDKRGDTERAWDNCRAPKVLFVLAGATHFTFAQGSMDWVLGKETDWGLRTQQHQAIKTYCGAMFVRYLNDNLEAEQVLTTKHPLFIEHRVELQ